MSTMENKGLLDLASIRLSQNFGEIGNVKKMIHTVPVRKPNRQEFFRLRGGEDWQFPTMVLELKTENETFLVASELQDGLFGDISPRSLRLATTRQGVCFIWPLRLPGPDGRLEEWGRSALVAAENATRSWIKMVANRHLGAYEVYEAVASLPEPEWPDKTFEELVRLAFRDRYIDRMDHPVRRQLRGEA